MCRKFKSDNYYNNQKTYADKTMDEYSPMRLPINVEICNQMMTTSQYKGFKSVQRLLKKNHRRTNNLEVQKIRKSVKDEKK